MGSRSWTKADIPNLTGKVAIVTGATSGIGYETALALCQAGATTIIAGRNEDKGNEVVRRVKDLCPNGKIEFGKINLASLSSVTEFAQNVFRKYSCLDILVNNAGCATPPKREVTEDGFEITFGTNYLSHFRLTARLLPLLRKSSSPRVVTVTSGIYTQGTINFQDLQSEKCKYGMNVFAQSKLANVLFAMELQRKSDQGGWGISSMATNPGFCKTEGVANMGGAFGWITNHILGPLMGQTAGDGALVELYAATSPDAKSGTYYAPNGFLQMKGGVSEVEYSTKAKDPELAAKLWDESTNLTNSTWP